MSNGIMKYKKENNKVLVVLEKGDEIFESIYKVIEEFKINFGWINGLGAAEKIIMGAYPSKLKKYVKKKFSGEYEIASMMGNITIKKMNLLFIYMLLFQMKNAMLLQVIYLLLLFLLHVK